MNKEQFLFLLGIRAELMEEADVWIEFGIDIDSRRTTALWNICDRIVKQCEKELELTRFQYNLTTLSWALEAIDKGEAFKWTENGIEHSGKNFEDLWNLIKHEKEVDDVSCRRVEKDGERAGTDLAKQHDFSAENRRGET